MHKYKTSSLLVDEGANGRIAENDVSCIAICSDKTVNIMGIGNHRLCSTPLVSTGGVSQSQLGPIILIFRQCAYYGKGKSIHSHVKLEGFRNKVGDTYI